MKRLIRWFRDALLMLLLMAAILWVMDRWRAPSLPPETIQQKLLTLEGKSLTLAEQSAQHPLLVYFWASWCGICRLTTPSVATLVQDGHNVLAVALRSGDDLRVQTWMTKKGLTAPGINDSNGALASAWQISATPAFIVIDQGKVVSTASGWTSRWGLQLRLWWAELRRA